MSTPIVVPLSPTQVATADQQVKSENYLMRALVAIDQLANVLLFDGKDDETISANTARMALKHEFVGSVISKALDVVQRNHGAQAIAGDAERAREVLAIENATAILPK